MNRKPLVSIGMPVYNGEPYLEEAIKALLAQTFEDFEFVISDNASTDNTEQICRDYMVSDARINYFRNEQNLGAAKNYNRVFELCSAKYFKWATNDDLCAPEYLEKCVEVLEQRPDVVICYPRTTIIDENGDVIRLYDDQLNLRFSSVTHRFRELLYKIGESNAVFGVIRRDALHNTPLIGNYPGSDTVLLQELTLYGPFWELPEHLFFRREHAKSSSSDKSTEYQQEFFDPKTKGKIFMRCWRHHYEHLLTIRRSPLKSIEKAKLVLIVLRLMIMVRQKLMKEISASLQQLAHRAFSN